MKLFLRYLKSRLGLLLLFAAFALILAFSFVLYHLPAEAVLYPAALCLVLGAVVLAVDFIRVRRRHILVSDLSEMEFRYCLLSHFKLSRQEYADVLGCSVYNIDKVRASLNNKMKSKE